MNVKVNDNVLVIAGKDKNWRVAEIVEKAK